MIRKLTNKQKLLLSLTIFVALGILYYFAYSFMNPYLESFFLLGIVIFWIILLSAISNNKEQKSKCPNHIKYIAYIILIPIGSAFIYIFKFSNINNKKEFALLSLIAITIVFIAATIFKFQRKKRLDS